MIINPNSLLNKIIRLVVGRKMSTHLFLWNIFERCSKSKRFNLPTVTLSIVNEWITEETKSVCKIYFVLSVNRFSVLESVRILLGILVIQTYFQVIYSKLILIVMTHFLITNDRCKVLVGRYLLAVFSFTFQGRLNGSPIPTTRTHFIYIYRKRKRRVSI